MKPSIALALITELQANTAAVTRLANLLEAEANERAAQARR